MYDPNLKMICLKDKIHGLQPRMPLFYLIPEESAGKPPQKGSMTSFFGAGWGWNLKNSIFEVL